MKIQAKHLGAEETSKIYKRKGIRRFLHHILPESVYDRLCGARVNFNLSWLGVRLSLLAADYLSLISRSGLFNAFHYSILSREFDREHQAVLAARSRHICDVNAGQGNLYMLRRNVH